MNPRVVPKVVALDRDGQSLGEAEVRHSNIGCTIMAVKGAWRYRVTGSRAGSALPADRRVRRLVAGLEYPIDGIVRGFTYGQWSDVTAVEVERISPDGKAHDKRSFAGPPAPPDGKGKIRIRVPADAKQDERLWYRLRIRAHVDGRDVQWTGWFTGLASRAIDCELRPAATTPQKPGSRQELVLCLKSNLPEAANVEMAAEAAGIGVSPKTQQLRLEKGREQELSLAYALPARPALVPVALALAFPQGKQTVKRWLRVTESQATVADLAKQTPVRTGLAFRGKPEQSLDTAATGAQFHPQRMTVGGLTREGFFCHPPYKGGVGYAFGEFRVTLPDAPCVFETHIGFSNGSTSQDGCVFSVQVKTGEKWQTVAEADYRKLNAWRVLRADLGGFAGREVALRLVTDVGPKDNSYSDWACWGEPRIVFAGSYLLPQIHRKRIPLPIDPPRIPLQGLKPADLKTGAEAKIILDGAGVNHGEHTSYAYLNDTRAGKTPASNSDTVWSERQEIPVPAKALATIGRRNVVVIRNPGQDCMKVRCVHLWFRLRDGRVGTSRVANGPFCSDEGWLHAEGQAVPLGSDLPPMPCDIPVAGR